MVVARKHVSHLVQGRAASVLCLRVVGTAHRGRVVRLAAPKCTIGSAIGCSLRLRAAGVRPLHCLILRGQHGTVIRSWAPNTRLNGQPFSDAVLSHGDRLGIGPIELEVIDAEPAQAESSANAEQRLQDLRLARDAFEQQRAAWASENHRVHLELEQQAAELDEQRERQDRLHQDFEQQRARLQAQFDARLDQLEQEQQRWTALRDSEETRMADQRAQFEAERAGAGDLQGQRQSFDAQCRELDECRQNWESKPAEGSE